MSTNFERKLAIYLLCSKSLKNNKTKSIMLSKNMTIIFSQNT